MEYTAQELNQIANRVVIEYMRNNPEDTQVQRDSFINGVNAIVAFLK